MAKILNLFRRRRQRMEQDLDRELRYHIDRRVDDLMASGLAETEARRRAAIEIGGVVQVREEVWDTWMWRWLSDLGQDVGYAIRLLRKQPGFVAAAIITLALGIGANTAIFSLVNALLLQRLPVVDSDALYIVGKNRPVGGFSYPVYADLRDRNDVLEGLLAVGPIGASLNVGEDTQRVRGAIVSGNFFELLGVRAILGGTITPQDDVTRMAHPVVVLNHGLWQQQFGGRTDIIGRKAILNGQPFTVIGILPAEFDGIRRGAVWEFYVPMMMQPLMRPPRAAYSGEMDPDLLRKREGGWLFLVGRLKRDVTAEQAQASLSTLWARLDEAYRPAGQPPPDEPLRVAVTPLEWGDPDQRAQLVSAALLLFAVVGIVLLIACANVANLLLSRAASRRGEIALRLALGASRPRLVRQLLTESVLLAALGGVLGVLLAVAAVTAVRAWPPPAGVLPLALEASIDRRMLAFALLVSMATGLAFGLVPAFSASRPRLVPALKEGGDAVVEVDGRRRRFSLKDTLVVAQVALSLALLVIGGLFVRSLQRAQAIDVGFDVERLLSAPLEVNLLRYTTKQGRDFYRRVLEATEALPGVESASVARVGLLPGGGRTVGLLVEGRQVSGDVARSEDAPALPLDRTRANVVGPGYLETLAIPLMKGRDFSSQDTETSPPVVIVNRTLVRQHFPDVDPVGRRVSFGGPTGPWVEIIGVVGDSKYASLGEAPEPIAYRPLAQNHETGMTLLVRAGTDPARLIAPVRKLIRTIEPNLPVADVRLGRDSLGESLYAARMGALLLAAFGFLALFLAAVGLYAVLAYATARRTREVGIRLALGADTHHVFALVVRDGMRLVGAGVVLGLAGAAVAARSIESFLYGVPPLDSLTFVGVVLLLSLVALLACLLPARRAMKVDPTVSLRST